MKTRQTPRKKPEKKQTSKEEIIQMSNLILQRNIDVYRELAK